MLFPGQAFYLFPKLSWSPILPMNISLQNNLCSLQIKSISNTALYTNSLFNYKKISSRAKIVLIALRSDPKNISIPQKNPFLPFAKLLFACVPCCVLALACRDQFSFLLRCEVAVSYSTLHTRDLACACNIILSVFPPFISGALFWPLCWDH